MNNRGYIVDTRTQVIDLFKLFSALGFDKPNVITTEDINPSTDFSSTDLKNITKER